MVLHNRKYQHILDTIIIYLELKYVPYFPDYKSLRSISHISQKMHHEEEKNINKLHLTISRIYLEINFTKSKTKNRHLFWKGKLFNYTIAHRTTCSMKHKA